MPIRCRQALIALLALVLVVFVVTCGGEAPEATEPVAAKPKGPNYEEFAPLPLATMDATLPLIVGGDTEIAPCFQKVADLAPAEADIVTKDLIEKNQRMVEDAIRQWIVEKLEPTGVTSTLTQKWSITVDRPVELVLPIDQVRLTDTPDCLTDSGWLAEGRHLAITLIGATAFTFESSLPLNLDTQEAMLEAVGLQNMVMESESLFVYEPAMDADGQPMTDPDGGMLYTSPTGQFIKEGEVPAPEKRMMKEWTLKSDAALYFAFKAFPRSGWRKEGKKDQCNVILIPDALTPQPPDCPEFQESAFSVSILPDQEKPVSITITTGEENKGVTLDWKEGAKIQVNDRIILWLMPEKVEVGVNLYVNSLVLNPQPMPDGGGEGEGYEPVPESAPAEAAAEEEEAPQAEDDEPVKPKKKKGKQTDQDAIDDFLND